MFEGKIIIRFDDVKEAEIFYKALKPEETSSPRYRTKAEIVLKENELLIIIRSKDLSSFRAATNSFLRLLNTMAQCTTLCA